MINEPLQRPWWKEPMIWLIAGLPAAAVLASFTTYFIAADKPDTLVNAGYQKVGMAPGKDTTREERAAALAVSGELEINNGIARLTLSGRMPTMPDSLQLLLLHPTLSELDVRVHLQKTGQGTYEGPVPNGGAGKRQWVLEPDDGVWRLAGALSLPLVGATKLSSESIRNHP